MVRQRSKQLIDIRPGKLPRLKRSITCPITGTSISHALGYLQANGSAVKHRAVIAHPVPATSDIQSAMPAHRHKVMVQHLAYRGLGNEGIQILDVRHSLHSELKIYCRKSYFGSDANGMSPESLLIIPLRKLAHPGCNLF